MKNTYPSIYLHAISIVFEERIDLLLAQMVDKQRIVSLTFFGESNQGHYEEQLVALKTAVLIAFDGRMPLVTYIVQSLGDPDEMAVEIIRLNSEIDSGTLVYKVLHEVRYVVFDWEGNKALLIEGVRANSVNDSVEIQSDELFQKIESILEDENIGIHEIVRQWNYIGKITDATNDIQNYQSFNNARARFYSKTNWGNFGYPAATGIGMSIEAVIVSLLAIASKHDVCITPINNPLQIAAHLYSQSMLVGLKKEATPKFERAKMVQIGHHSVCFISGTAAIRGEESMHEMDAAAQTKQTIENINHLISVENCRRHGIMNEPRMILSSLRVYYKKLEFLSAVKAEVEKVWHGIPVLYLQADICRKELLVEIEGIAENV
jgi:enamine deaminase RidA (YjgF/YER057c/UK114 family)